MLTKFIFKAFTLFSRNTPYFRGKGRICNYFNRLMLGVFITDPIAIAPMKNGANMLIDLRSGTEYLSYYLGDYDEKFLNILKSLLNKNKYFLDIGANIGFYTIPIAKYIKSSKGKGMVYSYEPFTPNFDRLLKNIEINEVEDLCVAKNYGLSDACIVRNITLREDFLSGAKAGNAAIPTNEIFDKGFARVEISLRTLDDDWVKNGDIKIDLIDLIKMDIEGHEDFCLKGGGDLLKLCRPTIFMEINKPYYKARSVDLDNTFLHLIPNEYRIYRNHLGIWKKIDTLNECQEIDNIFIVPNERLGSDAYKIFM